MRARILSVFKCFLCPMVSLGEGRSCDFTNWESSLNWTDYLRLSAYFSFLLLMLCLIWGSVTILWSPEPCLNWSPYLKICHLRCPNQVYWNQQRAQNLQSVVFYCLEVPQIREDSWRSSSCWRSFHQVCLQKSPAHAWCSAVSSCLTLRSVSSRRCCFTFLDTIDQLNQEYLSLNHWFNQWRQYLIFWRQAFYFHSLCPFFTNFHF